MPEFNIVFSSVVDVVIEADDIDQAKEMALDYPTGELDWQSNAQIESVEEEEE